MLSGDPLMLSNLGDTLLIQGTDAAEQIEIRRDGSMLAIANGLAWSATVEDTFKTLTIRAGAGDDSVIVDRSVRTNCVIYGEDGNDALFGGSGHDRIYGGLGHDSVNGGNGRDLLVDVGGGRYDQLAGGRGFDTFWLDQSRSEKIRDLTRRELASGATHRIRSFYAGGGGLQGSSSKDLLGQSLTDPRLTSSQFSYRNFADRPLFADDGPSPDDVYQGAVGDCYLLASVAAIAKVNPQAIEQTMVDLGDGTYAVQFQENRTRYFVRVDADLPVYNWGALAYAGLGRQNCLWVAILEKAYAMFRYGGGSYAMLDGGWMDEVNSALGFNSVDSRGINSADELLSWIDRELDAGRALTLGTYRASSDTPLIAGHAYQVDSVVSDASGGLVAVRLRNPWGCDGAGNDGRDDGYVTVTAAQIYRVYWAVTSADV